MIVGRFPLLSALSLATSLVAAVNFHVSPSGSDANNGTLEAPFQSLHQAQSAVRNELSQNPNDNITVYIDDGEYILSEPLNFSSADSGSPDHQVLWTAKGSNAVISGGTRITGWTLNDTSGIYTAAVAPGILSRNLYVNGSAANYARRYLNRTHFQYTRSSITWELPEYDWLMASPDIAGAEIRAINSFTDRCAPIEAVGDRQLVMLQNCWRNQIIGYDTFVQPNADFGFWVQNALSLLSEGGQFHLDSDAGLVYYMPLAGEDMSMVDSYLGTLKALVILGGTYDDPVHDISFEGLNFRHTTWLKPGQGYGYIDQQTGAYIGENTTYPAFEAARPRWHQMPSAIQIYAASNITFNGGSYAELGSGGFGIGNGATAYESGLGLGAQSVSVTDGYFTQVMGNSITLGGVRADAHHPSDPRMTVSHIQVTGNIFYNVSSLFSATVPIFVSYIQYSEISNNDIYTVPYSGICHGYGWGSNDAGGTQQYADRGLYAYQPRHETPTTSQNNIIRGNLIHGYGLSHTDLGATYTLAKSPSTLLTENYAFDSDWFGLYTDEGSNSYTATNNLYLSGGNWYAPNQGCPTWGVQTANNTLIDNFGRIGRDQINAPGGMGVFNNTFIRNYLVPDGSQTNEIGHRVAYRAGVLPGGRGSRPVTNPDAPDAYLTLNFTSTLDEGQITVKMSNFDDSPLTDVSFSASVNADYSLTEVLVADSIPPDSSALSSWSLTGNSCTPPTIIISATYTNARTQLTNTININGTVPGNPLQTSDLSTSSTWPSTYGQLCASSTLTIRAGGRDMHTPYNDWGTIYSPSSLGSTGSVTAQILSLDATNASARAGVIVGSPLAANSTGGATPNGFAALSALSNNTVLFQWDATGDGIMDRNASVAEIALPVHLRISVTDFQLYSGEYSVDNGSNWRQVGNTVFLNFKNVSDLDAGVFGMAGAGFNEGTAVFGGWSDRGVRE